MYSIKIKELRTNNNLLQKELAEILGIKPNTYSSYESEYDLFPIEHLNTLCNYFSVSFDYIFNFTNILKYDNSRKAIDSKLLSMRIKEFRKENNLTQDKLAKFLNIPQSMISYYEDNKNIMPLMHIYAICKKYKISADYLLGKIDEPKYLK